MLPSEDALWVGEELDTPLRPPALAVRADGDRRESFRHQARARAHRAAEDPRLQLVLPRHGRRDVRLARRWRGRFAGGQCRAAGRARGDDPRGRVERRRRARARARPWRCRLRPRGAGADEHRDRAPRARLPRRASRSRHASTGTLLIIDETHTLCAGPGRLHGRARARAGHAHRSARRSPPAFRRPPTGSSRRSPSASRPMYCRGTNCRRRRHRRDRSPRNVCRSQRCARRSVRC